MSAVLRGILGLSAPLHPALLGQRARLTGKISAREIGTAESVIGLSVMSAVMLVPAAWFLAHIENYKKRE